MYGSTLYVRLYTETSLIQTSARILQQKWSHVVFTYNATDNKTAIYINGTNISRPTIRGSSKRPLDTPVFLMGKESASDRSGDIDAYIDELAIWQEVLTKGRQHAFINIS